jgi:chitosanase
MIDQRAKLVTRCIISCHETMPPRPIPNYAQIARLPDGPGNVVQVTFGAHQATDRSDSLDNILKEYRRLAQEKYAGQWAAQSLADELEVYLPELAVNSPASCKALAQNERFVDLLKLAAQDPLMAQAQENVFEVHYFEPALEAVIGSNWVEPLSLAVVYDSMIHGSWAKIRDRIPVELDERAWIARYVTTRRWHMSTAGSQASIWSRRLLRRTVYRMDTFGVLIDKGNWNLDTPIRTGNGGIVKETDLAHWAT